MSAQAFILIYGLPFLALWATRERWSPAIGADANRLDGMKTLIWAWLGLGLIIRLPLLWDVGFHYDIGTYKAWALKLSDPAAPLHIYEDGYFADYPPLYMYVLASIGWFVRTFGLDNTAHFTPLIKLPGTLCDLAVSWLLLRAASRDKVDSAGRPLAPLFLASLYWFNPAIIFDSAQWGQTESVLALLLVGAWMQWRHSRLWAASILLGLAVAFKPQGLIFAYVFGCAVLVSQPFKTTLQQAVIGLASFAIVVLPFALRQEPDWIFQLYFSTADTYNYLTVNAYNLWALLGWNWTPDPGDFLGLATQTWAMLLSGSLLTLAGVRAGLQTRGQSDPIVRGEFLGWALAMAAMVFFMFAPRMHERYILNIIPMLALLTARRDARILLLLWSAGVLFNMGYVFYWYIDIDKIAPRDSTVLRLIAGYNLAITLLSMLVWLWPSRSARWAQKLVSLGGAIPTLSQQKIPEEPLRWSLLLPYLVLGIAALLLGSYQLGSKNYPLTGALIDQPTDIELQLPTAAQPARAMIFIGEGEGKATIQQKLQGDWHNISDELELKTFYDLYEPTLTTQEAGQSFRLHISEISRPLRINELGLLDAHKQPLLPLTVRDSRWQTLADEPQTLVPDQGYLTSTEFDEIYHGRTAWEYLTGHWIYETTHPPLGKWIISQGIKHSGMTPWGMRITGVIASVGILLALIWGAWLLTSSLRAMWIVGLLGLFEFSRYSIGRYSTIDPYLILFVFTAALLLWRAFAPPKNWLDGWRLSPSLLLAGLSLGAAIATKWNALYFGIGVFVFFLFSLYQAFKPANQASPLKVMLSAAIALGLVPLLVYYLSYIPFLRCLNPAPDLWSLEGAKQVWKSQVDMYDYHSKLTSTHAFQSAFYTWPLILKPLWLFVSEARAPLRSSLTLMGNPLIWWSGLAAILALVFGKLRWPARSTLWLLASILALYLPWAGVSRASFIYHYYPIVPFLVLLVGVTLSRLPTEKRWQQAIPWLFAAVSGGLFALFFPAISGVAAPASYFHWLHWIPGWWML